MNSSMDAPEEMTIVMDAQAMDAALDRMAREIVAENPDIGRLVILGILRRGRPLGERLAKRIGAFTGTTPPVGSLATTLYRDDVGRSAIMTTSKGETHFDFNVDGQTVLLVDDVLAAGRTIRAAMDEVMDYGRPARIQLACLLDRGRRELPIRADYLGVSVATERDEWVLARLQELDQEDVVLLERRGETPQAQEGA